MSCKLLLAALLLAACLFDVNAMPQMYGTGYQPPMMMPGMNTRTVQQTSYGGLGGRRTTYVRQDSMGGMGAPGMMPMGGAMMPMGGAMMPMGAPAMIPYGG